MKVIDIKKLQTMNHRYRGALINSLTGFKSANLIGSQKEESSNLAIISSAVHLGANPALMGMVFRPDVVPRDTLTNIRSTKLCTLNHVNQDIAKSAHQTSARYPSEVCEFERCKLTKQYLNEYPVPFVAESRLKMLLRYVREVSIHENGTHFLILSIEKIFIDTDDEIIHDDGYVDIEKINTVCLSGLDRYHCTQKIGRLDYAKPDKELKWLKD